MFSGKIFALLLLFHVAFLALRLVRHLGLLRGAVKGLEHPLGVGVVHEALNLSSLSRRHLRLEGINEHVAEHLDSRISREEWLIKDGVGAHDLRGVHVAPAITEEGGTRRVVMMCAIR